MSSFFRCALGFYHQHRGAVAIGGILLLATLAIQVGREAEANNWPQQWEFHQRIRFERFEHAVPLFSYPGGEAPVLYRI